MQYVIYCRKSSESEDRQVLSIDAQERELLEIAKKEGLSIIKVFKESKSAKDIGRPVFDEMLTYLRRYPSKGILTWKIDRLARNLIDGGQVIDLLQRGTIQVIRTHDRVCLPSDNVLMLAVEFGMANQYVRDLSVNVKRGNREKLLRGEWPNKPPFGYTNDKATKTISQQAPFVVIAFELYASGMSYANIANTLYSRGLRTSAGNKVYGSIFQRMIKNPFYMGVMLNNGKLYPGKHPALITQELFERTQKVALLGSRPRPQKQLFPLRGIMRSCNCMLTASLKKGHHYYYCTNGKQICEEHKSYIREQYLYPLVADILGKLHLEEELIEIMYSAAKERIEQGTQQNTTVADNLHKTLQNLTEREKRLLNTYLADSIENSLYESKMAEIRNEKVLLHQQIKHVENAVLSPFSTLEPIKNIFLSSSRAKKRFLEADDEQKQEILKNLLWNLSIKDKNIVSYQFKKEYAIIEISPKIGDISLLLPD
jgi:site-specific DNA recombinase